MAGLIRAGAMLVALAVCTGCSTTECADEAAATRPLFAPHVTDVLVLSNASAGDAFEDDFAAWESARRDVDLGSAGSPMETSLSVAEIRHREFLRTTNGRPHNDSYTTSRSRQHRVGP
jgi:hypothetical protein